MESQAVIKRYNYTKYKQTKYSIKLCKFKDANNEFEQSLKNTRIFKFALILNNNTHLSTLT